MLIICDFDGTVTARDTNSFVVRQFAPQAQSVLEGLLAAGEMSVRDVLTAEFSNVTAPLEDVVRLAMQVPVRAGFDRLLDVASDREIEVVLLSSGFRQLIEPILEREGMLGRAPLLANEISLDGTGCEIRWRDLPSCELCSEACKRHDVARLRVEHGASHVVFIGDGYSDRCGAETADQVFARDSLAHYLDERNLPYEPWDDFHDVVRLLELDHAEVAR